jgi:hypothetical protein
MARTKVEQAVNVGGALFVGSIGVTAGLVVGTVLQLLIQPNGNDSKKTIFLREAVVYVPAIVGGIIGYKLAINP